MQKKVWARCGLFSPPDEFHSYSRPPSHLARLWAVLLGAWAKAALTGNARVHHPCESHYFVSKSGHPQNARFPFGFPVQPTKRVLQKGRHARCLVLTGFTVTRTFRDPLACQASQPLWSQAALKVSGFFMESQSCGISRGLSNHFCDTSCNPLFTWRGSHRVVFGGPSSCITESDSISPSPAKGWCKHKDPSQTRSC